MWTAPLNVVRFGATTLWHFDAEERAPSTTSITAALSSHGRGCFTPKSSRRYHRPGRQLRATFCRTHSQQKQQAISRRTGVPVTDLPSRV
jgi:hypothetical protein